MTEPLSPTKTKKLESGLRRRMRKLQKFVNPAYKNRLRISKIPSKAIRQALADLEFVTRRGATIHMNTWGRINGECQVCLAGAVLLAHGQYTTPTATRLLEKDIQCTPLSYLQDSAWRLRATHTASVCSVKNAFNHLRMGDIEQFLQYLTGEPIASAIEQARREKFGAVSFYYGFHLDDECLDNLKSHLSVLADQFEAVGH